MKKLAVFALMVMFLASTVSVSAYAAPCPQDTTTEMSQVQDMAHDDKAVQGDMPCHEHESAPENQSSDEQGCCEGLCLHCHFTQAPFTHQSEPLRLMPASKDALSFYQDRLSSFDLLPPRRPPNLTS